MNSEKTTFLSSMGCISALVGIGLSIYFMIRTSVFMGICFGVALIVVSIILFARSHTIQEANRASYKRYIESFTSTQSSFSASQAFTADSLICRLAIDEKHQLVSLWQPADPNISKPVKDMPFHVYTYPYADLLDIKMFVNGKWIGSSSHQNNQQMMEDKVDSFNKLSSLILRIQTRKQEHEMIVYTFVPENGNNYLYKGHELYYKQLKYLFTWYRILASISNQNTSNIALDDTSHARQNAISQLVFALERIKDLKQMDTVIASNDEFNQSEETHILSNQEVESMSSLASFEYDYEYDSDFESQIDENNSDSSTEDDDPFADFERFLESNKQKQQGRS